MPVFALPSGLNVDFLQENLTHKDKKLSLLYVGGIGGVYDLKQFVKAVGNIPEVHLTICCRKDDWEREKTQYGILPLNVRIVHGTKEEVKKNVFPNRFVLYINKSCGIFKFCSSL